MSAYALPGSFFPPIVPPAPVAPQPPAVPLSQKYGVARGSDVPTTPAAAIEKEEEDADGFWYTGSDLIVAVKSASVDPMRLVRSLARGGSDESANDKSSMGTKRGRGKPPRGVSDGKSVGAPDNSPVKAPSGAGSAHDEAVQFHLSIQFNGRKYTATRTLPRFVQLRNELVAEVRERGRAMSRRARRAAPRPPWRTSKLSFSSGEGGDGDTVASWEDNGSDGESDISDEVLPDCDITVIPELPIGNGTDEESSGGTGGSASLGFAGRGFAHLQASLRSYCPAMEGWLRQVASVVPPSASPSLARFLWEPLRAEDGAGSEGKSGGGDGGGSGDGDGNLRRRGSFHQRKKLSSCKSLATLNSIDEFEGEHEHDHF